MMYPLVLFIITIVVVIFLMLTIVPTFTAMFADFGAELPFITLFVMGISDLFKIFGGYYLLLIIIAVVSVLIIYLKIINISLSSSLFFIENADFR